MVSLTIVQQWFDHNRGLANGIFFLGGTAASIGGPILLEYFIRLYAYSGALMLNGALMIHLIAFALIMKSPPSMINARIHTNTGPNVNIVSTEHQTQSVANIKDGNTDCGVEISEYHQQPTVPEISIVTDELVHTVLSDGKKSKVTSCTSITGSKQDTNAKHQPDPTRNKLDKIDGTYTLNSTIKINKVSPHSGTVKYILKNIFNFSLMKDPVYVLSALCIVLTMSNRVAILSQTVSAAVHKGHTYKDSAYLITILGFTNLVCRLISSVVMNLKGFNPMWYCCVGALSLTGAGFVMAFAHSYPMFVCGGILMGGFEGKLCHIITAQVRYTPK